VGLGNVVQDGVAEDQVEALVVEGEQLGAAHDGLHLDAKLARRRIERLQHPRRDIGRRRPLDQAEL
jgi:hypothetical protein